MNRCKEAFEKWFQFSVCDDMDIQTEIAWEHWQAAWQAARETLNSKAEEAAYDATCSMWLTAATSDREKYAYRDGHHRGWRDAAEHLAHNDEAHRRDAAGGPSGGADCSAAGEEQCE